MTDGPSASNSSAVSLKGESLDGPEVRLPVEVLASSADDGDSYLHHYHPIGDAAGLVSGATPQRGKPRRAYPPSPET